MAAQRILVNASYAPSLVNFRGPLMRAMRKQGCIVQASAPDIGEATRAQLADWDIEAHQVPLSRSGANPLADLAYRNHLRALIRDVRPDLVLGYTIKPCVWGSLAAAAEGVRSASLVTGLGYAFEHDGSLAARLKSRIARQLWRRATRASAAAPSRARR